MLVRSWKLFEGCGADTCEKGTAIISVAGDKGIDKTLGRGKKYMRQDLSKGGKEAWPSR